MKVEYINSNDWVYAPSLTKKPLKVIEVKPNGERVIENTSLSVNANGFLFAPIQDSPRIAFLATPENKSKLESIYGKLEDIPVNPKVKSFTNLLDELIELNKKCTYASNSTNYGDYTSKPNEVFSRYRKKYSEVIDYFTLNAKVD